MQDFTNLRVWHLAHRLRVRIFHTSRGFPVEERFGLTSQINRSAGGIGANIAESCGYTGGADSARFIQMALGSLSETLNHLMVAHDLNYINAKVYRQYEEEITGLRQRLIRYLQRLRKDARKQ